MIRAKSIQLKPFKMALCKLRSAILRGRNQEGIVGVYWKFISNLIPEIIAGGFARMSFNYQDNLVIDVQTKRGPNMRVLVDGCPIVIGIWLDKNREQKIIGSRRGKYYLIGVK